MGDTDAVMAEIKRDVEDLKRWRHEQAIREKEAEVRQEYQAKRFDQLDARLDAISSMFTKALWILGALLITALGRFVLNGGLNIVP